jgi:hypothetical protein
MLRLDMGELHSFATKSSIQPFTGAYVLDLEIGWKILAWMLMFITMNTDMEF